MESCFKKEVKAGLDSPRQELSNGGLRIAVALLVVPVIDFLCACTRVSSGCNFYVLTKLFTKITVKEPFQPLTMDTNVFLLKS